MKTQSRLTHPMTFVLSLILLTPFLSTEANAWGRRGHSIVCQTAASIAHNQSPPTDEHSGSTVMREHSFDLGYYCNVPDFIWKRPGTYTIESPQHFMDLEDFKGTESDFGLSRAEFEKKHPSIEVGSGRSYWRIRELMDSLGSLTKKLAEMNADGAARFPLQQDWLITAGTIGHYVGDLSQPLHVTANYDGQSENAKGIHSFFEEAVVDELSALDANKLDGDVGRIAAAKAKAFFAKNKNVAVLQLLENLAKDSSAHRAEIAKIDKRIGRKNLKQAARAYEALIKERLAAGSLTLALLWSRNLDFRYEGVKFFNFAGQPDYIYPPGTSATDAGRYNETDGGRAKPSATPTPKP